jgi:hypothetical protein
VDREHWPRSAEILDPLLEAHEGYVDLPPHRQLKVESTVRYLGTEVDDALAIAEQVDL